MAQPIQGTIKGIVTAALVVISLAGGASTPCSAVPAEGVDAPVPAGFQKKVAQLLSGEHAVEQLKSIPDLPNLPAYTGKAAFERGCVFPNTAGGATFLVEFNTHEDGATVINWYQAVLRQQRWKLDSCSNGLMVCGMDSAKNRAQIVLRQCHVEGYLAHVVIQFKQGRA